MSTKNNQDAAILALLQREPQTGLARLLDAYGGLIHGVVRRVLPRNPEDAEECVADVLVAAWQNAPQLARDTGRPLQGWLALTARHIAIDRYRRLRRRPGTDPLDETLAADSWMLEPRSSEGEDCIAELVAALPAPDHEIFLRRYYLMESSRSIAAALGMNEHTVNVRLSRGRAKLRQQYLERMHPNAKEGTKR